jgi:hypothetical protein
MDPSNKEIDFGEFKFIGPPQVSYENKRQVLKQLYRLPDGKTRLVMLKMKEGIHLDEDPILERLKESVMYRLADLRSLSEKGATSVEWVEENDMKRMIYKNAKGEVIDPAAKKTVQVATSLLEGLSGLERAQTSIASVSSAAPVEGRVDSERLKKMSEETQRGDEAFFAYMIDKFTQGQIEEKGQLYIFNDFSEKNLKVNLLDGFEDDLNQIYQTARAIISTEVGLNRQGLSGLALYSKREDTLKAVEERYKKFQIKFQKLRLKHGSDYQTAYERALRINAQFVSDLLYVMSIEDPSYTIERFLRQLQLDVGTNEPIIVNRYKNKANGKFYYHIQRPIETLSQFKPGRLRTTNLLFSYDPESKKMEGLSRVTRLPNYNPTHVEDALESLSKTMDNCKLVLTELTRSVYQDEKTSKDQPFIIPYRAMHLLPESAKTSILEIDFAMRSLSCQVLEVDIEGKKVWIKPEMAYMNLGIGSKGIQGDTNARTLMTFTDEGYQFLNRLLHNLKAVKGITEIESLINEVKKLEEPVGLTKKNLEANMAALKRHYQDLDELLEFYQASEDVDREVYKRKIEPLKKKIEELERDLTEDAKRIKKARVKAYSRNKKLIQANWSEISNRFNRLKRDAASGDDKRKIEEVKDFYHCFISFQNSYLDGKHYHAETATEVQAWFLLVNQAMGYGVQLVGDEWATGKVDDKVHQLKLFHQVKGYYPRTLTDWEELNKTLPTLVHKVSVNQSYSFKHRRHLVMSVPTPFNQEIGRDEAKRSEMEAKFTTRVFKLALSKKANPLKIETTTTESEAQSVEPEEVEKFLLPTPEEKPIEVVLDMGGGHIMVYTPRSVYEPAYLKDELATWTEIEVNDAHEELGLDVFEPGDEGMLSDKKGKKE